MWYGRIFVVVHCKHSVPKSQKKTGLLEACLSFNKMSPKISKKLCRNNGQPQELGKKKKTNKNKSPVSCHHLTQMLYCFASKHAGVTWSLDVTFDFAIYLCSQKYNNKIQLSKNLPKCFSLMVTFYIRGSKLMLFSCRKFCCCGKIFYYRSTVLKTSFCSS